NRLQHVVHPEVVSDMHRLRNASYRRDNKEVEEIQAVAHSPDVSDDRMAEQSRAQSASEGSKIEDHDDEGEQDMTPPWAQIPDQRPAAKRCHIPNPGELPILAGHI